MPTDTAPIYAIDLYAGQGADFDYTFAPWLQPNSTTPYDLTGFTATFTGLTYAWSTTPSILVTQASSSSGVITLGGALGTVRVQVAKLVTSTLLYLVGPYNLKLTSPGGITALFALGRFHIDPTNS